MIFFDKSSFHCITLSLNKENTIEKYKKLTKTKIFKGTCVCYLVYSTFKLKVSMQLCYYFD